MIMMPENPTISQVPDKDYCCDYDAGKYDNDHHQAVNFLAVYGKRYHKQYRSNIRCNFVDLFHTLIPLDLTHTFLLYMYNQYHYNHYTFSKFWSLICF